MGIRQPKTQPVEADAPAQPTFMHESYDDFCSIHKTKIQSIKEVTEFIQKDKEPATIIASINEADDKLKEHATYLKSQLDVIS